MKKRICCLILAAMLLSGCAAGQNDPSTEPIEGTNADAVTESETETEAEPTVAMQVTSTYSGYDYGGYEYRILSPGPGEHFYYHIQANLNEVYAEELNGDLMNDAIYQRNAMAEDLLSIKVTPIWSTGDTSGITSMLKAGTAAGSDEYDAVINRMDFLGTSLQNGDLQNLRAISTLNVEHPWWDKNIVDDFTLFGDRLYWIAGDINFVDDYAVEAVFFSMSLCDDHGLAYPYTLVKEGTWTIDRMLEMANAVKTDVNGDGKYTVEDDVVGHLEQNDHVKHWMYAMGEKSIDIDDAGNLRLRILDERQIGAIDKLYNAMVENEMTYTGKAADFAAGHALFYGDMLAFVNQLREMTSDFGIIPMPKYDEAQESYGEYISNGWTTAYAVPMTNGDPERTGVILEALSGYSTDTVRQALYEVSLSAKLVRDADSVEMLDIIFGSKSYDWAVDFTWGSGFASLYNGIYTSKKNNYVSTAEKKAQSLEKTITDLMEKVKDLAY
ncbi:MAG: hypothetical protein SOZ09_03625 [Eubacteriales bacterium]|nr:hypothetical protein [Eubacteriales bacterium]